MTLGTGGKKEVHKNTGPFKNKYQKIKPNKKEQWVSSSPEDSSGSSETRYIGFKARREKKLFYFIFLTMQEDQADLGLKGNKPQNCFRPIISWNSHQSERGASWEWHSSREWKEWRALSSCQSEAESQVSWCWVLLLLKGSQSAVRRGDSYHLPGKIILL